ncbi:GEVED domain-containing protein [Hanstruepera marina]|uniref:GEVED domain-containing protein n=1 Tax=Hanstruepera marina TaxID=2873265 RepID=UPI001CA795EA|nr:GEVED domain-containing protein [Hanstruepera marina]
MKKFNTFLRGITILLCLFSMTLYGQTYNGTGGPIPTGPSSSINCGEFSIPIAGLDSGSYVSEVTVNITHPYDADVEIYLVGPAPNNTEIPLSISNGGSGANYTNTVFSDSGTTSINSGFAPFSGTFSPEQPLSSFTDQENNGTWTLKVCDNYPSLDDGTLDSWSISFAGGTPIYCEANPIGGDGNGFSSVLLGSTNFPISMPNASSPEWYEDLTGSPVDLQQGLNTNLDLTLQTGYTYNVWVWIDFGNDGTFDPSDLVSSGISTFNNPTTLDLDFTMPAGAALGVHRMRISGSDFGNSGADPCYNGDYTAVADLDVNIITQAPATCDDGIQNGDEEGVDCGGSFCDECPLSYCDATPEGGDGNGITSVVLGSTTLPISMPEYYADETGSPVVLQQGLNTNLVINYATGWTYDTFVWIDFDDDGVFDPSDLVSSGISTSSNPAALELDFTMPAGAALGVHRMRIHGSDYGNTSGDPCANSDFGAVVDLDVEIVEAACTQAVYADATIVPDCDNFEFSINVDITTVNDAVSITDGSDTWIIAGSGITTVGPFDSGASVDLTIVHSESDCDIDLETESYTCPPANDTCEGAIAIGCGGVETGSTEFANSEDLADCEFMDTSFPELNTGPGVWYTVVGTGGDMVLDLSESSFDTKIALYSGSCNGLVLEDCDDDSGTGLRSKLTFTSENETVYYVYVTGWNSSSGDYVLTVDCICDAYIVEGECVYVTSGYGPADGTSLTAVGQFGEAPYTYEWSTGETGETIFVAPAAQTVYSVIVTDNIGCTSEVFTTVLVEDISCGDNPNNVKVNVCHNGEQICVSPNAVQAHLNHGDSLGACDKEVDCSTPPLCDARLKVPGPDATDVSTNVEISWDTATGLVDGYLLSVGTTDGGTDVLDNLDIGNTLDYDLSGLLDFATTYYVTITPYNSIGSADNCGASSVFTTETGPWCGGPTVVCDDPFEGDTSIDGEVNGYLSYCDNDLNVEPGTWHTFIGTGGDVIASLCNSTYDTRIGVFTGDCSTISCVAGNNDNFSACGSGFRSEVEFSSIEGATYYIFVSGDDFSNPFTGPYTLELTCAPPPEPCNDNEVTVNINFDNYPSETSWEITDDNDNDNVVASGDNYSGETFTSEVTCLPDGCYTFTIYDSFGDGICCTFGSGSYNVTGTDTTISGDSFENSESTSFCVSGAGGRADSTATSSDDVPDWSLYPNPSTTGEVQVDLSNYLNQDVSIQMTDFYGKILSTNNLSNVQNPRHRLNTQGMSHGIYFVRVATESGVSTKKLIIANN